jgi:hypothetical protein
MFWSRVVWQTSKRPARLCLQYWASRFLRNYGAYHSVVVHGATAQYWTLASSSSGFQTCDVLRGEVVSPCPATNIEDQVSVSMIPETGYPDTPLRIGLLGTSVVPLLLLTIIFSPWGNLGRNMPDWTAQIPINSIGMVAFSQERNKYFSLWIGLSKISICIFINRKIIL